MRAQRRLLRTRILPHVLFSEHEHGYIQRLPDLDPRWLALVSVLSTREIAEETRLFRALG